MLTKEAQKQLWDSDFSTCTCFPSRKWAKSKRSRKTRRKIFVRGRLGRANPEIDAISEEMVKIMTQK